MDLGVLGRDRHHLAAAEGNGTDIAVLDVLRLGGGHAGGADLVLGKRNCHAQLFGGKEQPRGMFLQLVDAPAIDALALEHAGAVMQAVRQHMGLGVLPGHQLAVVPKAAVALVEGNDVCHLAGPRLPAFGADLRALARA